MIVFRIFGLEPSAQGGQRRESINDQWLNQSFIRKEAFIKPPKEGFGELVDWQEVEMGGEGGPESVELRGPGPHTLPGHFFHPEAPGLCPFTRNQ